MEVLNDEIADEALKYARPFLSQGRSADYIPELSKVVIDSLISGNNPEDKLRHLTSFFRKVFNNEKLNYNKEVYLSEKATGLRVLVRKAGLEYFLIYEKQTESRKLLLDLKETF